MHRRVTWWSRQKAELQAAFLLGLLFVSDDGDDIFFRNASCLSPDYKALRSRDKTYQQ
jgi:hypothetical protein